MSALAFAVPYTLHLVQAATTPKSGAMQAWELVKDSITLVLSITAFLLSVKAMRDKDAETQRTMRMELSDVTDKINALAIDNAKAFGEALERAHEQIRSAPPSVPMPPEELANTDMIYMQVSRILSQQGLTLARKAMFLMDQIPKLITDAEYSSLANVLQNIGDYTQADRYWRKAVESSEGKHRDTSFSPYNKRGYAQFLFAIGEVERARTLYQRSLEESGGDSDAAHYMRGTTYQMWGLSEWNFVSAAAGRERFARAEESFNRIRTEVMRRMAIAQLASARHSLGDVPVAAPPQTPGVGPLSDLLRGLQQQSGAFTAAPRDVPKQ